MEKASDKELVAHVVRRMAMGTHPDFVTEVDHPDEAIERLLDLSGDRVVMPDVEFPDSYENLNEDFSIHVPFDFWIDQMVSGPQPLVERLIWFWHDHFAVSHEKVYNGVFLWMNHELLRTNAAGNFRTMLHGIAKDPAMLVYLDGEYNTATNPNENFGREVMELYSLGVNQYTERDVANAARAFTGWTPHTPDWESGTFPHDDVEPWHAYLNPEYHDGGVKTLLGTTGRIGMEDAIELMLEHPATAPHIAGKLHQHLLGVPPDPSTAERLGKIFRRDYEILPLVRAIVTLPEFLSIDVVRNKVRTPLEKLIAVFQGFNPEPNYEHLYYRLGDVGYRPFDPPNPAGYHEGARLLSPAQLMSDFLLVDVFDEVPDLLGVDVLERLALYDISDLTRGIVYRAPTRPMRLGLAFGSPEFALT